MRVGLDDIEVGDLNNVCVMLISKFARVLREHNGQVLRLRDKGVLSAVARHASQANNPELDVLHMKLKTEVEKHLAQTRPPPSGLLGFAKCVKSAFRFNDNRAAK